MLRRSCIDGFHVSPLTMWRFASFASPVKTPPMIERCDSEPTDGHAGDSLGARGVQLVGIRRAGRRRRYLLDDDRRLRRWQSPLWWLLLRSRLLVGCLLQLGDARLDLGAVRRVRHSAQVRVERANRRLRITEPAIRLPDVEQQRRIILRAIGGLVLLYRLVVVAEVIRFRARLEVLLRGRTSSAHALVDAVMQTLATAPIHNVLSLIVPCSSPLCGFSLSRGFHDPISRRAVRNIALQVVCE